ncbi:hypothetical protein O9G_003187 [Rozella allomycis CSF55]|uniref:Uncharacterized protein n=1 Tax=Rozella allomycis (strain CSF55) TaxID=988480 RepID=A0A075AZL5_ROZAC|nr:hypothetical protein O9G_003187 [Rozella allomycis CSF55]|eukprot:EPZ34107.1 hypothetical protein O9G_003187 [Rozella allomycis CSF55]
MIGFPNDNLTPGFTYICNDSQCYIFDECFVEYPWVYGEYKKFVMQYGNLYRLKFDSYDSNCSGLPSDRLHLAENNIEEIRDL